MNAKLQLAMDDGFLDATALRLKLQKHLTFDAELQASQERIDRLRAKGEQLLEEDAEFQQQDGGRVRAQLDELTAGWAELLARSSEKAVRLRQAHEAHQLGRRIAELEGWLERVEAQIGSEDHGTDLGTAEQLAERFNSLQAEITAKAAALEELNQQATQVVADEQLAQRAEALQSRWEAMGEPCQIRAENLVSWVVKSIP